MFNTVKYYAN